jgi:hypothetical protein|tara:strand:+ start:7869 stop:8249 length:381 start_codon:yes stop_codon:yes gene_type:complete
MSASVFKTPHTKEWKREEKEWRFKHPHIPQSFYVKIIEPKSNIDAETHILAHRNAVDDFLIQLELIDQELEMLKDPIDEQIPEYKCEAFEDCQEKKKRLILGKRFHVNAANAYSYWLHLEKQSGLN